MGKALNFNLKPENLANVTAALADPWGVRRSGYARALAANSLRERDPRSLLKAATP
jgi:hypothetical protein